MSVPPSIVWSIPSFADAAVLNGWIDCLPVELTAIIGGYFCAVYEWRRPSPDESASKSGKPSITVDRTGAVATIVSDTGIRKPSSVYGTRPVGSGLLNPYFAVRIRLEKSVRWLVRLGVTYDVDRPNFVNGTVQNDFGLSIYPTNESVYSSLIPSAEVGGYMANGQDYVTTAGRIFGIDNDSTITIGCVCDLKANEARFYLNNQPFVEGIGNQQYVWSIPNIRSCHPYAVAFGIPVRFEFVPDWTTPTPTPPPPTPKPTPAS